MSLRLLPEVVELHQLPDGPGPHLLVLYAVEVLPVDPEPSLEGAALLLRPEGHRVGGGDGVHPLAPQRLLHVVAALEQQEQSLAGKKVISISRYVYIF